MSRSVIFIRGLVAALETRGFSADPLLRELALNREALADLKTPIADDAFELAIAHASTQLDDDALGLTIAAEASEHTLQLLSSLVLSAESLRAALKTLKEYAVLLADDLQFALVEDSDRCRLFFTLAKPFTPGKRFLAEYSLVMIARLIRRFARDAGTTFHRIALQHAPPEHHSTTLLFERFTLEYGSESNEIEFARAALDPPQPYADARSHQEYRDAADRLLVDVQHIPSVSDRVRSVLRTKSMLMRPSMKQVSSVIGLQPRTLARSLSAEGKSFRVLVDEARCVESCEALRLNTPIAAVAELVGFSEPSAFHRAFRRWTGQTPAQYVRSVERGSS